MKSNVNVVARCSSYQWSERRGVRHWSQQSKQVKATEGHNAQDPRSHRVHPRASRQRPHQCLSSALWEVQAQRVSLGQQIGWLYSNFARFGTQLANLCDDVDQQSDCKMRCQPHRRRVRCAQGVMCATSQSWLGRVLARALACACACMCAVIVCSLMRLHVDERCRLGGCKVSSFRCNN
jgi:hypothetical protein